MDGGTLAWAEFVRETGAQLHVHVRGYDDYSVICENCKFKLGQFIKDGGKGWCESK